MKNSNSQKGQIFILALLLSASIATIALGMSSVILSGAQQAADVGRYVPAFYAADAGVERALYRIRQNSNQSNFSNGSFLNNALYDVVILTPGSGECPGSVSNICIFSKGSSDDLSRRIQVSY